LPQKILALWHSEKMPWVLFGGAYGVLLCSIVGIF